jgi:hypothetical protein
MVSTQRIKILPSNHVVRKTKAIVIKKLPLKTRVINKTTKILTNLYYKLKL